MLQQRGTIPRTEGLFVHQRPDPARNPAPRPRERRSSASYGLRHSFPPQPTPALSEIENVRSEHVAHVRTASPGEVAGSWRVVSSTDADEGGVFCAGGGG